MKEILERDYEKTEFVFRDQITKTDIIIGIPRTANTKKHLIVTYSYATNGWQYFIVDPTGAGPMMNMSTDQFETVFKSWSGAWKLYKL